LAALALALPASAQPDDETTDQTPEVAEEAAPIPTRVMADRGAVDRSVRTIVSDREYHFCNDPQFRVRHSDRDLCVLAKASAERCPEMERACARAADPDRKRTPDMSARKRVEGDRDRTKVEVPSAMSGLAKAIFWVLLLSGLVGLVIAIAKNLAPAERATPSIAPDEPASPERAPEPVRGPVETDAERLLARARSRAARGDYTGGLQDLHAALLRHLDQGGLISLHSASTNGEYVRALREHPELQGTLQSTVRDVERVQFGAAAASDEIFQRILRSIAPIVSRAVLLLVCAATALPWLTGCDFVDEIEEDSESRVDWGSGLGGLSLLSKTLEQQGLKVRHRVRSLEHIESEVGAIINFDPNLEAKEWDSLFAFAESGGLLVLADYHPKEAKRLGVRRIGSACDGKLTLTDGYRTHELFGDAALLTTPGAGLLIENSDNWPIALCNDQPYIVAGRIGKGAFVALPDADLMTNAALVAKDNAYFWTGLLGHASVVELVGPWTGAGAATPFEAMSNTRLTPVLIQILLLLLVAYLWRGAHFGTPRDPPHESRRAFAEHVRALGVVYAKARASRLVLSAYAGWVLDRLRERLQPGTDSTLHALAHAVAERTGRGEGDVMRILVEARTARDTSVRADGSPEDLSVMRELELLLQETGKKR